METGEACFLFPNGYYYKIRILFRRSCAEAQDCAAREAKRGGGMSPRGSQRCRQLCAAAMLSPCVWGCPDAIPI